MFPGLRMGRTKMKVTFNIAREAYEEGKVTHKHIFNRSREFQISTGSFAVVSLPIRWILHVFIQLETLSMEDIPLLSLTFLERRRSAVQGQQTKIDQIIWYQEENSAEFAYSVPFPLDNELRSGSVVSWNRTKAGKTEQCDFSTACAPALVTYQVEEGGLWEGGGGGASLLTPAKKDTEWLIRLIISQRQHT